MDRLINESVSFVEKNNKLDQAYLNGTLDQFVSGVLVEAHNELGGKSPQKEESTETS